MEVRSIVKMFLIVALQFFVICASAAKLPKEVHPCSTKSPEVVGCLKKNIVEAFQFLVPGYAPLKIQSLDPLVVPEVFIPGGSGPVATDQKYKNLSVHGLSSLKMLDLRINLDEFLLEFTVNLPRASFTAQYTLDGQILVVPVQGNGFSNVTGYNANITSTIRGQKFEKKGKTYLDITEFKLLITVEDLLIRFDNLFNGNKQLGDELNRLLNDNWKEIYRDVVGGYEFAAGAVLKDIANKIFKVVPFDQIFLPN